MYRILSVFEDSGQARRGYVVEGLGAAQFAMDGAVDRLRATANARERGDSRPTPAFATGTFEDFRPPGDTNTSPAPAVASPSDHGYVEDVDVDVDVDRVSDSPHAPTAPNTRSSTSTSTSTHGFAGSTLSHASSASSSATTRAIVLAAADPANAYGAALPWPEPPTGAGHKPGRKAGSLVVLVDGELTLYMERGGKTLLAWPSEPDGKTTEDPRLRSAAASLAAAARAGSLGTVTVERVNGASALTSPFGTLLEEAGFIATPRGLRLRA